MEQKIEKLINIYQKMNDNSLGLIKNLEELIDMGLTDEEIEKINNSQNDLEYGDKIKELLSLSSSIKYFVSHSDKIFKAII